jgi:hypothetical protein
MGLVAEFETPEDAALVARRLRNFGFHDIDAYGPFPSEELAEAIGFHEHRMAPAVLAGGILGGMSGFGLQYYTTVIAYPHNVGGRPHFSWPAYIPITFECTVLFATLTGIVALLVLNRLPRLAHPIFSAANFERATTDRFFLSVNSGAPNFSFVKAREILEMGEPPLSISLLGKERDSP